MGVLQRWLVGTLGGILICGAAFGQVIGSVSTSNSCSFYGGVPPKSVVTFQSEVEADRVIERIVQTSGLAKNFEVRAAGVDNAAAVILHQTRLVLYNPRFMSDMRALANGNDWAAASIMAHEVGHHLNGHTLLEDGSRPKIELEADYFSGFVLQKMGASLADAQLAIELVGQDEGSITHPARRDRLAAIAAGWGSSCDQTPGCRSDLTRGASGIAVPSPMPAAQATPVQLTQGAAQLPTSGLVIDLPAKPGIRYHVSGSWSLGDTGAIFDTRDVIDAIEVATGNVATGNWVLAGYFTAGGCDQTLASPELDADWRQTASLWGETWNVRGGVFTFDGALGRRPAAVLCRAKADGTTLLLYHFLANQPEDTSQAAVMDSAGRSAVLASASRSFSTERAEPVFPTRRTEVRNRGSTPAARTVKLAVSGLEVDLPADGYLWLPDSNDDSDFLDRLLPTFPQATLEVVFASGVSCADVFGSLDSELRPAHRPLALPSGWVDGPGLMIDGETEMTMCHPVSASALVVGVFQGPDRRDVSDLHSVLGALLAAAQKR